MRAERWPATTHDLAVVNHPDRRTAWVSAIAATLERPLGDPADRLRELAAARPVLGARLDGGEWVGGGTPGVVRADGEPISDPRLVAPFDLAAEAPLRVLVGGGGRRVALAAHHAALDGRGLVAVLVALLGGELPERALPEPRADRTDPWAPLRRLAGPADRVAASGSAPPHEVLAVREVDLSGPGPTARMAAACVAAASHHNTVRGHRFRRVGLSVAVAGPDGLGNVASYRRLDLSPRDQVEPAVAAALRSPALPPELVRAPRALRLLAPLVDRLSDSLLISNVGRVRADGVLRLENFPVARGRSAVAFGSCGLPGRPSTLSIRARDLSHADAEALLDDAARRLGAPEARS